MLVQGLAAGARAHIPTARGSTKWRDEATDLSSWGGVCWLGGQAGALPGAFKGHSGQGVKSPWTGQGPARS